MAKIKVGDTVMWRGSFGMDPAQPAVIDNIEQMDQPRSKYGGESVEEADWANKHYLLVTLTNGHWAYGEQISPMQS